MTAHPVLVVGGGPAGSVTALLLARAGHPVVVVDRREFPRAKACGECANPGTVSALRELGLAERVAGMRPGRLRGWEIQMPSGRRLSAPFGDGVETWTVERARFDEALLAAAGQAGAEIRTGVTFEGIDELGAEGGAVHLRNPAGRRERVRISRLVGADGLHSRVRAALDLDRPTRLRKVGISMHVAAPAGGLGLDPEWGRLRLDPAATLGLSALDPEGERWTLVYVARLDADGARSVPRTSGALLAAAARHVPELRGATPLGPVRGSGPYDRPVRRPWVPGAILVGDAAGYFDPVTGQGIGRAIGSARLAADALVAGGTPRDLARYGSRIRAARRGGVLVQRLIDAVTCRPALLERTLPPLERTGLLSRLIEVTGDRRPALALASPETAGAWLRALAGVASPRVDTSAATG
jgi:flavin-dependent dehydrogenase